MSDGSVKVNRKLKMVEQALKVEVSRDGNHLSNSHPNLSPERINQILNRINENYYDREDVLEVVANRILRSPELQALLKKGRIQ